MIGSNSLHIYSFGLNAIYQISSLYLITFSSFYVHIHTLSTYYVTSKQLRGLLNQLLRLSLKYAALLLVIVLSEHNFRQISRAYLLNYIRVQTNAICVSQLTGWYQEINMLPPLHGKFWSRYAKIVIFSNIT